MKVLLSDNPLAPGNHAPSSYSALRGERPAWVTSPQPTMPPNVMAFRLHFDMEHEASIRVHVSADERYQLYVDGQRVGMGSERGSDRIWFYETYDLDLSAGSHTFVALVWHLGAIGPDAQVGLGAGFLLEAEEPYAALVSTKWADWETKPVAGIHFSLPDGAKDAAYFVQPIQMTEGAAYPWGIECGQGEGWMPTRKRHEDFLFGYGLYPTHNLQPAVLPSQVARVRSLGCVRYVGDASWNDPQIVKVRPDANLPAEANAYQALLDASVALVVPPHTKRQIIMDLEQYVCAYPQITVSGGKGSCLTIGWAEALHLDASGAQKGQRDEVMGRTFIALCRDEIRPDGGAKRQFEPLWWRSGRYVQLLIETGDEPLTLEALNLLETRYPLEMESHFSSSDARLEAVIPVMLRALQMCAHETYMDCPYYEQLMYIGDTRLEALTTYTITADDRLPRKAINLFGLSQLPDGMIRARYPSREIQVIPPFSLWWIGMIYDYAMWRDDRAFIVEMLPKVRAVLDGFLTHVNSDNLLQASSGWNFADWTLDWPLGVPPDAFAGISGVLNWHLIYTLGLAAKLEAWAGEHLLARRWEIWQDNIASAARAAFWDEQRGLFADDQTRNHFSEHVQCLALLSNVLNAEEQKRLGDNLLRDDSLTRTTIYFSHYLFETYYQLRQPEALFKRMNLWFDLPQQGFKTTPEQPEPSRSDCHGWGAHPLYHYFATLLGIRPSAFGFTQVEISPMPGHLSRLTGALVHPNGKIQADLHFENQHVRGQISLPPGVSGILHFVGKTRVLESGIQSIDL